MLTRIRLLIPVLLSLALPIPAGAAAQQSDSPPGKPAIDTPQPEAAKPARKFDTVVAPPLTAAERRAKREAERTKACEHFTGSRLQREGNRKKRCPGAPGTALKRSDLDRVNGSGVGDILRK